MDDLYIALKNAFGDDFSGSFNESYNFKIKPDQLVSTITKLRDDFQFNFLLDITATDRESDDSPRFEVVYFFSCLGSSSRVSIRIDVDEDTVIPSLVDLWEGARWPELEIADLFGLKFDNEESGRLISYHTLKGHPLRKDFVASDEDFTSSTDIDFSEDDSFSNIEDGKVWVNFGPYHPLINSSFRLMAEMQGEQIIKSKMEIGLNHRGLEKSFESSKFSNIHVKSSLLSSISPVTANLAVAKACETALGVTIPERAQALRMVFLELSRIADHFSALAELGKHLRSDTFNSYALEFAEAVRTFFGKMTGHRYGAGVIKVGGLSRTLPLGWVAEGFELLDFLRKALPKLEMIYNRSSFWSDNLQISPISRKDVVSWGLSGPVMRSVGINYDLRKRDPFYFYEDLDFSVPLGVEGTIYERYLVRLEEIRQSIKIIAQLLDYVPAGKVIVDELPTEAAASDIYSAIEGSNGELGISLSTDGVDINRMRVRGPSYYAAQYFPQIANGANIDDALIGLLSLGIDPLELDR